MATETNPVNQSLSFNGTGGGLRISPLPGPAGKLTLEAWIQPTHVDHQQAVMIVEASSVQLVLAAGGAHHDLAAMLVTGKGTYTLATAQNAIGAGAWTHVAVTFQQAVELDNTVVSLYKQGQLLARATIAGPFAVLTEKVNLHESGALTILYSPVLPNCRIGGTAGSIGMFSGQMAEVRAWSAVRPAADLATNATKRAVGNETSLVACYRLEGESQKCVYDISNRRGFGVLPSGTHFLSAPGLPLPPTTSANRISLRARGKLVTETITQVFTVPVFQSSGGGVFGPGVVDPKPTGQTRTETSTGPVTVFDATIEGQSPDGNTLGGSNLQIWPDGNVTALLERDGGSVASAQWIGGQVQSVTLPRAGNLRLRFAAEDLTFPALRLRIDGMPDGLWTTLFADGTPHGQWSLGSGYRGGRIPLSNVDQQDLRAPANGSASPLHANSSADDAQEVAQTLQRIGLAMTPPSTVDVPASASARSLVGSLSSAAQGVVHTLDSGLSSARKGLSEAGSDAGSLAHALVDDGTAALNTAQASANHTANSLIASGAYGLSDLSDLVVAAAKATPRFGKSAIATCIEGADKLAFVVNSAPGEIAHTFAVIGTTLVKGKSVVWRLIVNGVDEALQATKSFFKRIGVDIQKFLKYLAWLFNWNDFLTAADEAYGVLQDVFGQIPGKLDGFSQYKSQFAKYLTIPDGIGNKSLANLLGVDINPNNPTFEELNYALELIQKLFDAQSLGFDGVDQLIAPLLQNKGKTDWSKYSSVATSAVNGAHTDSLLSPTALFTSPITNLLTGALTGDSSKSLVDFIFDELLGDAKTAISVGESVFTTHLTVPDLTSLIEKTILGGRSLTLLRIVSLLAAIPQVLESKLLRQSKSPTGTSGAPAATSSPAQPRQRAALGVQSSAATSNAAAAPVPFQKWGNWLNFSLSVVFSATTAAQSLNDLQQAKATGAQKKALEFVTACFDLCNGVISVARSIIGAAVAYDPAASSGEHSMVVVGGLMEFAAGVLEAVVSGILIVDARSARSDTVLVTLVKLGGGAAQLVITFGTIISSIALAMAQGGFANETERALFGTTAAAQACFQSTLLCKFFSLAVSNTYLAAATVGLSVSTALLDSASAALEAKTAESDATAA